MKDRAKLRRMKINLSVTFSKYTFFTPQGMRLAESGKKLLQECLQEYGIELK